MSIKIKLIYVLTSGCTAGAFSTIGNIIITLIQSNKENKARKKTW